GVPSRAAALSFSPTKRSESWSLHSEKVSKREGTPPLPPTSRNSGHPGRSFAPRVPGRQRRRGHLFPGGVLAEELHHHEMQQPREHLRSGLGFVAHQLSSHKRLDSPYHEGSRNWRWSLARGDLAARAVDGVGEALHQKIMFSKRSAARGVRLDKQRPGQGGLVGAELEQLGQCRAQALAPARLALGDGSQSLVEPSSRVAVGLGEAVFFVLEVLIEGRPAGPGALDHVLNGDVLVAALAA